MGADNQQGRPDEQICSYIAGFVDGEGSFHIAIQRSPTVSIGWQLIPEFHVTQHKASKGVLELIREVFGCGHLRPNHRTNPNDVTWVLVVRSREDLIERIIPFFERFKLRTTKQEDFQKFASIVRAMENKVHSTPEGFRKLLSIAFSMNANGSRRKIKFDDIIANLEPSETIRQTF